MTRLDLEMPLPADYRLADLLSFHRRDAQALAERVTDDGLDTGLLWQGLPACLSLRFAAHRVRVSLQVDGEIDDDPQPLEALWEWNPMAVFLGEFRRMLYSGAAPHWDKMAYLVAVSAVSFVCGYAIFIRLSRRVAEEL